MENRTPNKRSRFNRNRLIIISAFAWFAIMATTVFLFADSNSQDLTAWIADGSDIRRQYDRYVDDFGIDDVLMIAWDGCVANDSRLLEFESKLNDPREMDGLIRSATSGGTVVTQMLDAGLTKKQAKNRLRQIYFGNDGKTTCLVVQLTDHGNKNRREVILLIREMAREIQELVWDDVYIVGPAFFAVMMDYETNQSSMLAVPACIMGAVLTLVFVSQLRLAVPILFTSLLAATNGLGIMVLTGTKLNGLLVLMPPFVMVLCVSGCVHLVNYFIDELAEHDWETAVARATRIAIGPCSLSAITTSIALLSLCTSQIPAVRQFGFFTALSLLMGLGFILIVLKAMLLELRPTGNAIGLARQPSRQIWFSFCWNYSWVRLSILVISIFAFIFFSVGIYRAESALTSNEMFLKESRVRRSARWFQQNINGSHSVQVLVTVNKSLAKRTTDELDAIWSVQKEIHKLNQSRTTFSAVNFFGPVPPKSNVRNYFRRSALAIRLDQESSFLENGNFAVDTESGRIWRIKVGFDEITSRQYEQNVHQIKSHLESIELHPAITGISFTGMNYLVAHSQGQLFDELAKSFCWAFVFITPVMMIVLRGFWPGLIAMLPNISPTLIVFGGMGLLSIPITIGAVLTATVGLGIAVDDTLHFLRWFGEYKGRPDSRGDSIRAINLTVGKCLRPMTHTTVICGASLLVFIFASFIPVKQFGITIALLLLLALVCDLILLPVILASPLGKVFVGRTG